MTFWGLESAEIASNQSKRPLKCGMCPCISLESHLTKVMRKRQSLEINHPTTLGFSFFIFFFFRFPFFSSSYFFAAVFWPSKRLLLSSWILEKAITRLEILAMNKPKGGKGKFSSEFFTKISKRFGAHFKLHPIGLVKVLLDRYRPAPKLKHKCCLSQSKVMTSQVG